MQKNIWLLLARITANDISIGSAVLSGLALVSNTQTHTEITLRHDVCSNKHRPSLLAVHAGDAA